jgi:hypothetical protein
MIYVDEGSPIKKQIGKRIEVKKVNIKIFIADIHYVTLNGFFLYAFQISSYLISWYWRSENFKSKLSCSEFFHNTNENLLS